MMPSASCCCSASPPREPHVDGDLGRRSERLGLKPDPQPAVSILLAGIAARRHGVGEHEEPRPLAALAVEALDQQLVLVVEHGVEPQPADVAIAVAVDRVAEGHVVGGHGLRHGAGGAADAEKPSRDFLARADLGERAVSHRIEVDLERLEVSVRWCLCHECCAISPALLIDSARESLNYGPVSREPGGTGWPAR
jgi:hypothetical protein